MEPLDRIKALISGFAGYSSEESRRLSDEQVRAFVGERLAMLPASEIDALSPEQREHYDRVLLRCEFANQPASIKFTYDAPEPRVAATLAADLEVLNAAAELTANPDGSLEPVLERLDAAFDKRESAMQN